MKIRLLLSYKGGGFFGWQRQKNQRTVQGEIEHSLSQLFGKKISLIGSGRTDTGVHALGQTAHFELPELGKIALKPALNSLLPKDIAVLNCWKAPKHFHARASAIKKSYLYFIWVADHPPVLCPDLLWWKNQNLKLKQLNKLSSVILGERDFKSFQNSGSQVKSTVRSIYESEWVKLSPILYCYHITGSGFLKQMVRNLVGTFIDLLKHKQPEPILKDILSQKDRKAALRTAPGQGLYLKQVFYPSSLDKACVSL